MPDVSTGVELVSRATYISRKRRNWETRQRQSKAYKRAEREAKRKLMVQPEISHDATEQIPRSQATRNDENFFGALRVSHQLTLLHGHANVFFCKRCGAVNAGGTLRLLKSQCDGTGEYRQKARRKLERGFDAERASYGRCEAPISTGVHFTTTLLDVLPHRALSISVVIKNKKRLTSHHRLEGHRRPGITSANLARSPRDPSRSHQQCHRQHSAFSEEPPQKKTTRSPSQTTLGFYRQMHTAARHIRDRSGEVPKVGRTLTLPRPRQSRPAAHENKWELLRKNPADCLHWSAAGSFRRFGAQDVANDGPNFTIEPRCPYGRRSQPCRRVCLWTVRARTFFLSLVTSVFLQRSGPRLYPQSHSVHFAFVCALNIFHPSHWFLPVPD